MYTVLMCVFINWVIQLRGGALLTNKPEPIMLSVLPIIPSRISNIFTHYSYFILMLSPIIPVLFLKCLLCQ